MFKEVVMASTTSTETLTPDRSRSSSWVDRQAYPFRSRWLALPEGRLHYIDEGSGPGTDDADGPILLVHGTPTWSFEYRHLIAGLSAGRRVIALDHLGFGLSERPANASYTPEAHAARFRAFVDGLGLSRFTLVVHDFGGPIALPVALDDPGRVSRLVVLNSWMWSFADDPAPEMREMARRARMVSGGFGRFMYRRLNASLRLVTPSAYGDRRKLTRAIHSQYLAAFPDADSRERVLWALARALLGSSAFYDGLWQRRDQLAAIPTLIVWGMKDSAFRPSQLARWRTALPHATVVELAGAGHWPHEEEPARVLAEVRSFTGG
jgi:haloalkane dehalogenase